MCIQDFYECVRWSMQNNEENECKTMKRMNSECQTIYLEHDDSQARERVWYACARFMYVWCSHMNMIYVCNDVRMCSTHLSRFEFTAFCFVFVWHFVTRLFVAFLCCDRLLFSCCLFTAYLIFASRMCSLFPCLLFV